MRKNIILVGKPHSGKSTSLVRLITDQNTGLTHGFVTKEILSDFSQKDRVGFSIDPCIIAHIDFESENKVSKYGVDVPVIDFISEGALQMLEKIDEKVLLYLDEVGQMQLLSLVFQELVLEFLDSTNTCVMTMSSIFPHNLIDQIRKRKDIIIVEITPENREEQFIFVQGLIKKISRAKKYISQPERFSRDGNWIVMNGEHGQRIINLAEKTCTCHFFQEHKIC